MHLMNSCFLFSLRDCPGRDENLGSLGFQLFPLSNAAHWTTWLIRPPECFCILNFRNFYS